MTAANTLEAPEKGTFRLKIDSIYGKDSIYSKVGSAVEVKAGWLHIKDTAQVWWSGAACATTYAIGSFVTAAKAAKLNAAFAKAQAERFESSGLNARLEASQYS